MNKNFKTSFSNQKLDLDESDIQSGDADDNRSIEDSGSDLNELQENDESVERMDYVKEK